MPPSFQYGLTALIAIAGLIYLVQALKFLRAAGQRSDPVDDLIDGPPQDIPCPDVLEDYPELRREVAEMDSSRRRLAHAAAARPFRWRHRRAFQVVLTVALVVLPVCAVLVYSVRWDRRRKVLDLSGRLDRALTALVSWSPDYHGPLNRIETSSRGTLPPVREISAEAASQMAREYGEKNRKLAAVLAAEDLTRKTSATDRVFSASDERSWPMAMSWAILLVPAPLLLLGLLIVPRRPRLLLAYQLLLALLCAAAFVGGGAAAGEISGARAILEEVAAMREGGSHGFPWAGDLRHWVGPVVTYGTPDFDVFREDVLSHYERRVQLDLKGREKITRHLEPFQMGPVSVTAEARESIEAYFGPRQPGEPFLNEGSIPLGTQVLVAGLVVNQEFSPRRPIVLAPRDYTCVFDDMAFHLRGRRPVHQLVAALCQAGSAISLLALCAAFLATLIELVLAWSRAPAAARTPAAPQTPANLRGVAAGV